MGKKDKEDKPDAAENIKVLVRCRPLNSKELDRGFKSAVDLNLSDSTVQVNHVCGNPDRWTFDAVINNTYSQKDVFVQNIRPMVDSVLEGFNATIFAYGQSGSGKTHTMTGKLDDEEHKGITPRAFEHIFESLRQQKATNPNRSFTLYCSFIELYNNKIRDLLSKKADPLPVKENKDKTFFVQGAHIPQVKFPEDLYRHMDEGTDRRTVASTELNADSSRSHSIFTLVIECTDTSEDGDARSVTSKLNLVDLAGSERQSKTGASGDTLKEGCNINLSLSALGTVIDTLVKGKGHVPFRSSPLTMLLKDSLGGSSKTCMFANINPSEHNVSETVSTLRFADRAKQIKNKPVVNMDSKDQKIAELTEAVHELKEKLKQYETGGLDELEKELEELRERTGELEVERDNAVKGRESDAMDFQASKDQLEADAKVVQEKLDEATEAAERITADLQLSEQQLTDEKTQRDEIWRACTEFFEAEVGDIDTLLAKFKDQGHGANSEEFSKLQSAHHALEAEFTTLKEKHQLELGDLKNEVTQANDRQKAATKKFNRAKEMLEQERSARKQLVEQQASKPAGDTPQRSNSFTRSASQANAAAGATDWVVQKHELIAQHESEVERLQAALDELQASADNNERVQQLEKELKSVSDSKNAQITALSDELKQTTEMITSSDGDDSAAVANFKKLLVNKDTALEAARGEILKLEEVVIDLKRDSKKHKHSRHRSSSPKKGTKGEASADKSFDIVERVAEVHKEERKALRAELATTCEHRNELLQHVIGETDNDMIGQLKGIVDDLAAENKALREKSLAAEEKKDDSLTNEALRSRIEELEGELASGEHSSQEVVTLNNTVNKLQEQLAATRAEHAAKEQKLIDAMSANAPPVSPTAAGSSGATEGNPLQSVIQIMSDEKESLNTRIGQLEKELHAMSMEVVNARNESREASLVEVNRLQDLLTQPKDSDAKEVKKLKEELKRALGELTDAREKGAQEAVAAVSGVQNPQLEEDYQKVEAELRQKSSMFELEKEERAAEISGIRAELEAERDLREAAEKARDASSAEVKSVHMELMAAQKEIAASENRANEQRAEFARVQQSTESYTKQIQQLEGRVKDRSDQLAEVRKMLEKQKELMTQQKAKSDGFKEQAAEYKQQVDNHQRDLQRVLEEREASIHKAMNKKIEAIAAEHQKDLTRKDEEQHKLRKKIKKMDNQVQKAKEKYDEKVCEYEELASRMEEQKIDAMRMMRGDTTEKVEYEQQNEQIGDALARAKEERKRKKDMFAMGETKSALAQVRAVGPAVKGVQSLHKGSISGAPARSPLTESPAESDFDF